MSDLLRKTLGLAADMDSFDPSSDMPSDMPNAKTLINMDKNKKCQQDKCFCIETEYKKEANALPYTDPFHIFKRTEKTCTQNKDCLLPGHIYYDSHSTHATTYCDVDSKFEADNKYCENCLFTKIENTKERSVITDV